MATLLNKYEMTPEEVESGMNIDFNEQYEMFIKYVENQYEFKNKDNALDACLMAFNYGRYLGRNVSDEYGTEFADLSSKYEEIHGLDRFGKNKDPILKILDGLWTAVSDGYRNATKEIYSMKNPTEELLIVLRANEETDFVAQPKGFDELCARYRADKLEEDEVVYDEQQKLDEYDGIIFKGSRSLDMPWYFDNYSNVYGMYDQGRCPEAQMLAGAMWHGYDLQCAENMAHYMNFINNLDVTQKIDPQALYDQTTDLMRNQIKFGISSSRDRVANAFKGTEFYNHKFDNSLYNFNLDQVRKMLKLREQYPSLKEKRSWLADYKVDFSSRRCEPIMSNDIGGFIFVDSRECTGPLDAKLKVAQAYYDAGKKADARLDMPREMPLEEKAEKQKELNERFGIEEESFDPLSENKDPAQELGPTLHKDHIFLTEIGYKHVKDDVYVHPEYKCRINLAPHFDFYSSKVAFYSIFNAGYEHAHNLEKGQEPAP